MELPGTASTDIFHTGAGFKFIAFVAGEGTVCITTGHMLARTPLTDSAFAQKPRRSCPIALGTFFGGGGIGSGERASLARPQRVAEFSCPTVADDAVFATHSSAGAFGAFFGRGFKGVSGGAGLARAIGILNPVGPAIFDQSAISAQHFAFVAAFGTLFGRSGITPIICTYPTISI